MANKYFGCLYREFDFLPATVDVATRKQASILLGKEADQVEYIQELRERLQRAEEGLKSIRKTCQNFREDLADEDVEKAQADCAAYDP
jgi:SMC interacting uncharacterized protein involved in chromosome segregation